MAEFVINFTRKSISDGGKTAENISLEVKGATPSEFVVNSEQSTDCSKNFIGCALCAESQADA